MFTEDDLLPISALQHLEFCPRRCALVHVEGIWSENAQTAEGRVLHQRVHESPSEMVGGVRVARGLRLCSFALGLSGVADVVEFHPREGDIPGCVALPGLPGRWQPFPVEYKRGRRKRERSYFVQLCAQALCLEELSFLYTLLTHDVVAACESVGLDPQMGFLHADRSGRASLALDLVEELRSMLADRLALSLVNRQQIDGKGFKLQESGGVEMDAATRKTVLVAYQKRKAEELLHPFLQEKITVGLLPFVQARLLARWLRDELDAYPPFFWK